MKKRFLSLLLVSVMAFSCLITACGRTQEHTHTFSKRWSTDNTYHWHSATCEHDSLTDGKAEHSFNQVESVSATYESTGYAVYQCSVCQYQKTVTTAAKLEHNYSDTLTHNNGNTHWYACTDEGYENLKKDEQEHTFDNGVYSPATYENGDYTTYTCACGYYYTVDGQVSLEHNYSTTLTHNNGDTHWYACIDQGYEHLKKDEAPHTFDSGVYTAPTSNTEGYTTYTCICGYFYNVSTTEHNYSTTLTHDNGDTHWYACTDDGYEHLKKDEELHTLIETDYDATTGYATFTCKCGYTRQHLRSAITSLPTVTSAFIGQKLSEITLVGGTATVDGTFSWSAPNTVITDSGDYNVTFIPTDTNYASITSPITVSATQLTVTVNVGANGSANYNGTVNVGYNNTLNISFTPNDGYVVKSITVDDSPVSVASFYTFSNITANHTLSVEFEQYVIQTLPTPSTAYVGQTLSEIDLTGGTATVDGTFSWANPTQTVTSSGSYAIIFTPNNSNYSAITGTVTLNATQLTVTVEVGENGSADYSGTVNIDYNQTLTITFTANSGYQIDTLTVDGIAVTATDSYSLENVICNHTVSVTFVEQTTTQLPFTLTYLSGTENAYTYADNVLTFTTIDAQTAYSISGNFDGQIIIDVGDTYKFDLELTGFTLNCDWINPITVLSGDEVALQAKIGYENFINDKRSAIDTTNTTLYSAAIYSLVDLELSGKGSLTVVSDNNNGIHTKDDLQVKNLTLSVTCKDNALKGNDSVEITNAITTLIASQGDCIKTTNSHINETTLAQKGIISITGGTHNLYSACDGIDASYNVVVDDATTVLNVYTDQYSPYSEEVTAVSDSTYYLRYTSTAYKFSVKYYNSDSDYLWVNVSDSYETVTSNSSSGGRGPGSSSSTTYYYYTFAKNTNYSKLAVYMYSSSQTQGQDSNYYACSDYKTISTAYDTLSVTYSSSKLSTNWTNYTTTSTSQGGMQDGNTDKGTYSTKGIKASNEITINAGTIYVKAYDDAMHTTIDTVALENGEYSTGKLTVNGGTITLYSNDDGLHADGDLLIAGGTVNVINAYEGIEGNTITVSGGYVSVITSDDGFNSTLTSGTGITISGGKVYVYAGGDGIDSNSTTSKGAILFSGGDVVVINTSGGNAAIDSDGGYTHTAGKVIAIMPTNAMTSESTNGNANGMTTVSSISLSSGAYLNVTVSSTTALAIKMPSAMTAYVVYLGSSSATLATSTSTSVTLDSNGVYWG